MPLGQGVAGDLSGGQRQAVAIARAMLWARGSVMLMDEPTAALGVRETGRVLRLVESLRLREQGRAICSSATTSRQVFEVADRIVVLRHGRIVGSKRVKETSDVEIVGLIVGVA